MGLRNLDDEKYNKNKVSGRKVMIKIRTKIKQKKKVKQAINKPEVNSLKKRNSSDKFLVSVKN